MTAPHRYRVFISSTYLDNVERRRVVEDAVIAAGMHPVGMERFTADTRPTVEACERMAREADVLVCIVAHRYGWIPPGRDVSITEIEYDAAPTKLLFSIDANVPFTADAFDADDRWGKQAKLDAFIKRSAGMPGRFDDGTLGVRVLSALQKWREEHERSQTPPAALPAPAAAPAPPPLPADDVARYLALAKEQHDWLPVVGFGVKVRAPIQISDLYVPLRALVETRGAGRSVFADADDAAKALHAESGQSEIPLSDAFWRASGAGRRRGVVILGDPGSGKTTHLKSLLVALAVKGGADFGLPADMVPVFLPLRDLPDVSRPFEDHVRAALAKADLDVRPGFAARLMERGRILFLLDGLDEVARPEARAEVARWIERALAHLPDSRFAVTCRYAGYTDDARFSERFLEMHLRPLDDAQAETFVGRWFALVETALAPNPAMGPAIGREKAAKLLAELRTPAFRARRVYEMTRNPLLLTAICVVHHDRRQLPQRRADLYDECVDTLLERWRSVKGIAVTVPAKSARIVLQAAAYWLHGQEERRTATAAELAPVIAPALAAAKLEIPPAAFLEAVKNESGLLTGWSGDLFGFMHLGFQEYLAAREIRARHFAGEPALAELAGRFGQSWWREVGLLLLALDEPSVFEPYMRLVAERPAFATESDLVEECLDDAVRIVAAPFADLVARDAGDDADLAQRRDVAFRVLERRFPADAEALRARMPVPVEVVIPPGPAAVRLAAAAGPVVYREPLSGCELVAIPGGEFLMGSPETEEGRWADEGPQHRVRVAAFQLCRTPVTNAQYERYLEANPGVSPPRFWSDRAYNQRDMPVVGVSWNEARAFCGWAGLVLPSEAQWEYACRAGTTTRFWSGDAESDLARVGWYDGNSERRLHAVAEKPVNPCGLHDVHGNVWEWCEDAWHGTYDGAPADARAWTDAAASLRVNRGGSWNDPVRYARSACRLRADPGDRDVYLGFRPARSFTP